MFGVQPHRYRVAFSKLAIAIAAGGVAFALGGAAGGVITCLGIVTFVSFLIDMRMRVKWSFTLHDDTRLVFVRRRGGKVTMDEYAPLGARLTDKTRMFNTVADAEAYVTARQGIE